ncbi:hypothetical protein [Acidisarcina polymorpha]|uniref:hypothetical protein n=1 Tax=Acidisarcina polymorpha TaxID=2211140 RepID=UPI000DEF89DC|nr:hypothetical protein [Acidisarcina polymorpha]
MAIQVMVLSLSQFRGIYPEYASMSDAVLLQKLNRLFAPNYEPAPFNKLLTQDNGKMAITFILSELYESRGDAYLKSGDYRRGILDFQRIFGGIPGHVDSTERWRSLGTFGHGDSYYLDVKSSEVTPGRLPQLWVKRVGAKESEVMAFDIDCVAHKLRGASSIVYDSHNNPKSDSGSGGKWSVVAPDTLGEQLWSGVCTNKP